MTNLMALAAELESVVDGASQAERIAATDAVIDQDVASNNTEVGNLKARVGEQIQKTRTEEESDRVARENARRAKYGKRKMTADEAKRFEMFSVQNAMTLESVCEECTAYEDWFTFNRWIAQGLAVQKGQRGTKITVYVPKDEINRETGAKSRRLFPKSVACFCRHQVKAIEQKGRAA